MILDGYLTREVVSREGLELEANPLVRSLLKARKEYFYLFKVVELSTTGVLLYVTFSEKYNDAYYALLGLLVFYSFVISRGIQIYQQSLSGKKGRLGHLVLLILLGFVFSLYLNFNQYNRFVELSQEKFETALQGVAEKTIGRQDQWANLSIPLRDSSLSPEELRKVDLMYSAFNSISKNSGGYDEISAKEEMITVLEKDPVIGEIQKTYGSTYNISQSFYLDQNQKWQVITEITCVCGKTCTTENCTETETKAAYKKEIATFILETSENNYTKIERVITDNNPLNLSTILPVSTNKLGVAQIKKEVSEKECYSLEDIESLISKFNEVFATVKPGSTMRLYISKSCGESFILEKISNSFKIYLGDTANEDLVLYVEKSVIEQIKTTSNLSDTLKEAIMSKKTTVTLKANKMTLYLRGYLGVAQKLGLV